MPEYGSIKKKAKKGEKPKIKKSEVVSAYSEEGKKRQERLRLLNAVALIGSAVLLVSLLAVFLSLALTGVL